MPDSPGLAYWAAAIAYKSKIDEDVLQDLISHPRFPEACKHSAQNWLARINGSRAMARLALDMSSAFYSVFTLYLDARGELTLAGMKKLCAESGHVSSTRATALMLHLMMSGYVKKDPDTARRRNQRLAPEPLMVEAIRESFQQEILAFSLIEPEAQAAAACLDDPIVFRHFILIAGEAMVKLARNEKPNIFTPFANHSAGMAILFQLATSGQDGDVYPPCGTVRISVHDMARRFNVSRTHTLRFLRKIEALGLIRRNPDEATGTIEEALRKGLKEFHAGQMLAISACVHLARRETESTP